MRQIRRFQDLTIGDNYMFGAVMMENDNCRQLLERVLEMPISRVEVIKEKSMIYHPECKGVRLDVYAKDEKNPDEVVRRIDQETDMDKITVWAQLVVKAKSLEDFVDQM